tara:strand:+ start:274 stop:462 length:189 start_codon:yes stop_codon:yes gene_type:complete
MDKLIKGAVDTLPAAKELIEVQEALPLPEPESNGSLTDVGIVVAGVIVLAALYKFWLRYGKK